MALVRTNVTLPEELLSEVDALTGRRGRSRYVAEAVEQRVKRDRLARAIRDTAGVMVGKPGRRTPEQISRWIDELRSGDRDAAPDSGRTRERA